VSAYAITWYPEAAGDLDALIEHLRSRGSHVNAERVLNRIEAAVGALRSFPHRGRIVPELAAFGVTRYREVIVAPWRIVYRFERRAVFVLTLVDSRRELDELLLERLVRSS